MTGTISRRSAVTLGAAVALGAAVGGAAVGGAAEAQAAPKRGGKLTVARHEDASHLDPVFARTDADIRLLPNLYDTLVAPAHDGKSIEPALATAWTLSDDGRTLTLTLREGVRFCDGSRLLPTDVKWSLDRARDPANGPWASLLGSIDAVTIDDRKAIVLTLKHPDATILAALASFNAQILPGETAPAPGATDPPAPRNVATRPIGTGPFMLAEWKPGESMLLKRNPYYWKRAPDGGKLPYLDAIAFTIVADDVARLAKVRSGEAHGTASVPYAQVKDLQADPKLRVELWPSTSVSYLVLNCRPTFKGGGKNPMSDARVRKALNHALDKPALIAAATFGIGQPMTSFMSTSTPMHTGSREPYPYDPAIAKTLLAQAGFASGFELACLTRAGNQLDADIMTKVQQMWGAVGVKATIQPMDTLSLAAKYTAGDFAVLPGTWADRVADPSPITASFAYSPDIDCLHSGWKDPTVDYLFVLSQAETDPTKRAAEYTKLQEIYVSEAPIVFLQEMPFAVLWQSTVSGFVKNPVGYDMFEAVSL